MYDVRRSKTIDGYEIEYWTEFSEWDGDTQYSQGVGAFTVTVHSTQETKNWKNKGQDRKKVVEPSLSNCPFSDLSSMAESDGETVARMEDRSRGSLRVRA